MSQCVHCNAEIIVLFFEHVITKNKRKQNGVSFSQKTRDTCNLHSLEISDYQTSILSNSLTAGMHLQYVY